MSVALLETSIPGLPVRRGKVRDVYDLGGRRLLFVATDRISAFDWVLPDGIPDKGRVLTGMSAVWFDRLRGGVSLRGGDCHTHVLSTDIDDADLSLDPETRKALVGRSMIVKKAEVIPFECVVRGFLSGSAWKEYQATGSVCGVGLPSGLLESDRLPEAIFTPATKAETGHDENVPFARLVESLGVETAEALREMSLWVYHRAWAESMRRGLILADTKLEWGRDPSDGGLLLVDEVLTPDSSRYWPADQYRPGGPQPSFDKQFVRDWLETSGWDKASPPPHLPADVIAKTREKYVSAYKTLTGRPFPWE